MKDIQPTEQVVTVVARYSALPLPPYTYVPGRTPHPVSDPAGHAYAHREEPAAGLPVALPEQQFLEQHPRYRYAIDLYNHGFYWEAHEAWESLWIAAGRRGPLADFLKGLIKLAAAGVKSLEGNPLGWQRHLARSRELLAGVAKTNPNLGGLNLQELLAQTDNLQWEQHATRMPRALVLCSER